MKHKSMRLTFIFNIVLAVIFFATGCAGMGNKNGVAQTENQSVNDTGMVSDAGNQTSIPEGENPVKKEETVSIDSMALRDKDLLYTTYDDTGVVTMYLTVRRGNEAEGTNHSWEEINTYSTYDYDAMGVDRYQVEGILQVGDENGPLPDELGYGAAVPNATIQIRGQTSSRNAQKNYKIRLKDNKGLWRGQQTINLNKHQTDGLRFRNKMAYDLMRGIPQMMSLRTQFVHLYVKDETTGTGSQFEDYGLYTQVEQLNKMGMRAHGLDTNGHLYKINFFEFFRYEDVIMTEDSPGFDKKAFDRLLECKGNHDHTKLIQLLEEINDASIPTEEVLEKHFNMENLSYWMAFHILTGNIDTQSRNVYIYSPQNSRIWYFISWDNDTSFKRTEQEIDARQEGLGWDNGVSNYWGNALFQRCLKSEMFRNALDTAINDLRKYLSEERLSSMVETYSTLTAPYVYSMPDQLHAPLTQEEYEEVKKALPSEVEENYRLYLESYEKPMPFHIRVPFVEGGKLECNWDVAYDFQAEDITYTAEISSNYDMSNPVATYEGVWPQMETEMLPPGQYFLRVTAKDASGNEQYAFDYYVTERGKEYGIKCFYILPDGSISEDIYEE